MLVCWAGVCNHSQVPVSMHPLYTPPPPPDMDPLRLLLTYEQCAHFDPDKIFNITSYAMDITLTLEINVHRY